MPGTLLKNETLQLIIALLSGLAFGLYQPELAVQMRPLSEGFILVLGWLMPWVIFILVASSVASLPTHQGRPRLALSIIVYFQLAACAALLVGMATLLLLKPGVSSGALLIVASPALSQPLLTGLLSAAQAILAHDILLQVLLLALLAGVLLRRAGPSGSRLQTLLQKTTTHMFRSLRVLMRFAPVAAFGAVAFSVGRYGPAAGLPLVKFVGALYVGCLMFVCLVLAGLARLCGVGLWRLALYLRAELLMVVTTGSTLAALPGLLQRMEALGCAPQVARLVMTTGYSFNLNGSSLYLSASILFLAQLAGVELSCGQLVLVLLVSLLTSLGSTSIPGAAFMTLVATLNILHLVPAESVGLLLGVERVMKCRSVTNVLGNCVACLVISKGAGSLDTQRLGEQLPRVY